MSRGATAFTLRDFDASFGRFQQALPGGQLEWLQNYREAALAQLRQQGLPGRKTEDWKYTSVRALMAREFEQDLAPMSVRPEQMPELPDVEHRAVMINGCFNHSLSHLKTLPPGVAVSGLATALARHPHALQGRVGATAVLECHPFAALNSAFFHDGLVIEVASGVRLAEPLLIQWLSGSAPCRIAQPRLLIDLGKGAELTLMEHYGGGGVGHFNNQLTEISLGENAQLTQVTLHQSDCDHLIHGTHVCCGRDSRYRAWNIDLDGVLLRNDLAVRLEGRGAECSLDGLFLVGESGHVDNHIRIDHQAVACRSRVFYKGLLGKGGRGVFNGKVIVHPEAQQTDARQVNCNLLLSRDVEIDSKPELEIYADDVKCSHGSTAGELDTDSLFYLRSRGISLPQARALLAEAFAREIIDRLRGSIEDGKTLRNWVTARLMPHLHPLANSEVTP